MTADDILLAARSCLETPFRHQGRQIGVGLDCAGLLIVVAQQLGLDPVDVDGYGRSPAGGLLESALDRQTCLQPVTDISTRQPGDLLLLRFSADPQHLAIDAGATMIHAYAKVGKCCEHRLSLQWAARIVRVYRFAGVET